MPTVSSVPERLWPLPVLVCVLHLVSGALNAGPLLAGARPSVEGVLASAACGTAWLVWAFVAGRRNNCRTLRGMAGFWAVVIVSSAICCTFVRLDARSGLTAGGWMVVSLLVVAAAPLYGVTGVFAGEPLSVLTSIAAATGALSMAVAAMARKFAPTAT